jgi:hypothetical protein
MGGHGSGKRFDSAPRRLVERSFGVDVRDLNRRGLEPGTEGSVELRAALLAWRLPGRYAIREAGGRFATIWFVNGLTVHLPIELPEPRSYRQPYFRCPHPRHQDPAKRLAARLYWPVLDPAGFACRACHRLAYRSSQARTAQPLWMRRMLISVGTATGAGVNARSG